MERIRIVAFVRSTVETAARERNRRQGRSLFAGRPWRSLGLLSLTWLVTVSCATTRLPSGPPPTGRAWVQAHGEWLLVQAPPSDGPYEWVEGRWVAIRTPPPPGTEWVPGHWGPDGWIPGHWAKVGTSPGPQWVPGHWEGVDWVAGHWTGGPGITRWWIPEHGEGEVLVPGHWAGNLPKEWWVPEHLEGGVRVPGHWVGKPPTRWWVPDHIDRQGNRVPGRWE